MADVTTTQPTPYQPQASPYYNPNAGAISTPLPVYTQPQVSRNSVFSFDPNQYLPQIQQTASAIYTPQIAQLEALRQLSNKQTEQTRVVTKEDFAKRMQSEIEAINARGAFFGGGALDRQSQINTDLSRALENINLQAQAGDYENISQQAQLAAAMGEYTQNKLSGAENSAYSRFRDLQNYQQSLYEFEENKKWQKKQYEYMKKKDKAEAKKLKKQFEQQNRQFEEELAYKYYASNLSASTKGGGGDTLNLGDSW